MEEESGEEKKYNGKQYSFRTCGKFLIIKKCSSS